MENRLDLGTKVFNDATKLNKLVILDIKIDNKGVDENCMW